MGQPPVLNFQRLRFWASLLAVLAGVAGGALLEAVKWHPRVRIVLGQQQQGAQP